MMAYPKKRWSVVRVVDEGYDGSEALLQGQLDDLLAAHQIWFLRFPDNFFRWIKMNAPAGIQRFFFGVFGGIPDNLCMLRVSDKYMLCCPIELKSKEGRLHGKQKHWEEKGIAVQVSRSPERNISIIKQFRSDADIVRGLFEAQRLNGDAT